MRQQAVFTLALGMALLVALHAQGTPSTLLDTPEKVCDFYGNGTWADFTAANPLCSRTYILCEWVPVLNATTGQQIGDKVEMQASVQELGFAETAYGYNVSQVFNAFSGPTGGPALPGAIGTMNCDCSALYPEDTITRNACAGCNALQMTAVEGCDPREAITNQNFSCIAEIPKRPSLYINCGVAAPFIQVAINGTVKSGPAEKAIVGAALEDL